MYGVIGTARLRHQPGADGCAWVRFNHPFAERHVYSATLLNVNAISRKGVTYPAWMFWEDMRLNSRCFMNDLKVVKFMQFLQVKRFKALAGGSTGTAEQPPKPSPPPQRSTPAPVVRVHLGALGGAQAVHVAPPDGGDVSLWMAGDSPPSYPALHVMLDWPINQVLERSEEGESDSTVSTWALKVEASLQDNHAYLYYKDDSEEVLQRKRAPAKDAAKDAATTLRWVLDVKSCPTKCVFLPAMYLLALKARMDAGASGVGQDDPASKLWAALMDDDVHVYSLRAPTPGVPGTYLSSHLLVCGACARHLGAPSSP